MERGVFIDGEGRPPLEEALASSSSGEGVWLLCYFLYKYNDFRIAEAQALAELAGCGDGIRWRRPHGGREDSPFWYVRVPSLEKAKEIAKRSLLIKVMIELWAEGGSFEEMVTELERYPEERKAPFLAKGTTFRVDQSVFGSKFDVHQRMQKLAVVPWQGTVSLTHPEHVFWYISQETGHCEAMLTNLPERHFFGREICRGDRHPAAVLDLRQRRYLGPTSMDAEVALLMANCALARKGSMVYDPFLGTGSMAVAAGYYGAAVLGSDIDMRVIKGLGKKCKKTGEPINVWTNFQDYGLPSPIGVLRFDLHVPPFRRGLEEILHGIVADPPYGVRAGGRKSGGRKGAKGLPVNAVPEHHRHVNHFPSTAPYALSECLADLLDLAARLLVQGGRLVYFYPCIVEEYHPLDLPTHPCLEHLHNCEDPISIRMSRRLITLRKCKPYYAGAKADAAAANAAQAVEREKQGLGQVTVGPDGLRKYLFFGEKAEGKNGVGGGAGVAAPGKSEEAELGGPA